MQDVQIRKAGDSARMFALKKYYRIYQAAILKSALLAIQPMQFLNYPGAARFIDNAHSHALQLEIRNIRVGEIVRFFGFINSFCFFVQVLSRFYFMVEHTISYYFESNVQLIRIHGFMGSQFGVMEKFKTIYHKNQVASTFVLFAIAQTMFVMLLYEYEVKIYSLIGFIEVIYYNVISMTTVGYGIEVAQSFYG